LGGQIRAAASGLCEPAAGERSLWQAPASEERRVDRTELRPLLRHRWNEKDPSARAREHSQATVDSRRRVQSESDFPLSVGIWHPTGVEKPTVLASFCAFFAVPARFSTCASHKLFFFVVTTQTASKSSLSQIQVPSLQRTRFHHRLLGTVCGKNTSVIVASPDAPRTTSAPVPVREQARPALGICIEIKAHIAIRHRMKLLCRRWPKRSPSTAMPLRFKSTNICSSASSKVQPSSPNASSVLAMTS
jgi:hypothetical protein